MRRTSSDELAKMKTGKPPAEVTLAAALRDCRSGLIGFLLFSGAVNLLMLAGPLYMLQLY
jgi:ABC-type protease/lipase transport system fused ATPase/permease subunit